MKCYKCGKDTMSERKSEYGYYYRCSNCGHSFESINQSDSNRKFNPRRHDYIGNKKISK